VLVIILPDGLYLRTIPFDQKGGSLWKHGGGRLVEGKSLTVV